MDIIEKAKIDRINYLARKKKTHGLTEAETIEQKALREEYIGEIRKSFRATLDNIEITD